ncbi:MBL fold metallo-hydrolase [Zavarzinia sp. CC-PAN008]|uniref:MBL fold metallo-hydrolase n=1 Tax=Zavarzinia sp. CC-PAN008 TaxID=3243332 RepID=UPI003F748DAB
MNRRPETMEPDIHTESGQVLVRFWGVRGSMACAGTETLRYGGNTACVEVRCGPHLLLLDAGTGIRHLGNDLNGHAVDADILLSHSHFDHVCGLPFFKPLFSPRNAFRLWVGRHGDSGRSARQVLYDLMVPPLFPVSPDVFNAAVDYRDFRMGDAIELRPGLWVHSAATRPGGPSVGYRIEYGGKVVTYITDAEHRPEAPSAAVADLLRGADIAIFDASHVDTEHWEGDHSSWEDGLHLCCRQQVKTYVVFHHDPRHDDDFLDRIGSQLAATAPGAEGPEPVLAREGLILLP